MIIQNNKQYEASLAKIQVMMQKNISPDSRESKEFEKLLNLVEEYETRHSSTTSESADLTLDV